MNAKILLRIAAACLVIHLLGHIMGHLSWDKPADPRMAEVVAAMKGYKAAFMGAEKSMADYYHGYSLLLVVVYAMSAALLWIASGSIQTDKAVIKKMLNPFAAAFLLFGVIEFLYFFPFAAAMSAAAGLCTLLAVLKK